MTLKWENIPCRQEVTEDRHLESQDSFHVNPVVVVSEKTLQVKSHFLPLQCHPEIYQGFLVVPYKNNPSVP